MFYFPVLIKIVFCHFLADNCFMNMFLRKNVGEMGRKLYNASIYSLSFAILASADLRFCVFMGIAHFFLEPLKSEEMVRKYLWLNQVLLFAAMFFSFAVTMV